MTHDELSTKLEQRYWKMFNHNSQDQTEAGIEHRTFIQNQYFALRAVVELHKPKDKKKFCKTCGKFYPCSTIQVIEEQLK
jgi:hypothetical protein